MTEKLWVKRPEKLIQWMYRGVEEDGTLVYCSVGWMCHAAAGRSPAASEAKEIATWLGCAEIDVVQAQKWNDDATDNEARLKAFDKFARKCKNVEVRG